MNRRTSRALAFIARDKEMKYRNHRVIHDGMNFDSKSELRRWVELSHLQDAGHIYGLKRQVPFKLVVNNELICTYIADHVFYMTSDDTYVVEDVKSSITRTNPDYRIKRKLMKAIYKIDVSEYIRRKA